MLPAPLELTKDETRRLQRRLLRLDTPLGSVEEALAHHAYIQIDPLNVCGRMHDLILRNRVAGYREGDLMRALHGDQTPIPAEQRRAFEHHLPSTGILVAFGLEAWPHLHAAMRQRTRTSSAWSGRLTPRERELSTRILKELEAGRGPLNSDSFNEGRQAKSVWGTATLAKSTLQKLFFHGELLIAKREGSRRFYDLPEKVLPTQTLAHPEAAPADSARWLTTTRLRQHRVLTLKRQELPLVEDLVQPLKVEGCPMLYCLREDAAQLEHLREARSAMPAPLLLAPLDPLLYDRALTRKLWDFDYTWEVYVPEAKRVRGYYTLPVLRDTELLGHVEPRADREEGRLRVLSRSVKGRCATTTAVRELAGFLGLRV